MTKRMGKPRRHVRRVVVVVPSLFTLASLFFGIWSIVLAAQGEFYRASWWIVIAAVLDVVDGLSARMSGTGSAFGAELDSLVDMVSFGVAPALLMYFMILGGQGGFAWVFSFGFTMCVALRLARFNTQHDAAEGHHRTFTGLPTTAAGATLATYYPFSQTTFFQAQLADLPWSQLMIYLMIALSLAMVSNIEYARSPRIGIKTVSGLMGLGFHMIVLWFGIWRRDIFFFPFGLAYVSYGLGRWIVVRMLERGDEVPDEADEPELVLHDLDDAEESEPYRRNS